MRRLLKIPDADRVAVAGESVPPDVDVVTALVGRRGAREGVRAGAALAGKGPPTESRVGFPDETAASIRDAECRDGVPDGGDGAEPCDHRR